ncbi:TylF/MycF/NovP-related O-methyltransferase [Nonomuraea turcica]|uniref:TylF/MycF/NovP-related O-methyltransferase n=1 Tax=Nonomuraea sp. G32 TaxID=3067274 RepID=UPI00273B0D3C|nr:TylF/MycF/NovP-related O-methyltransferase [Nonomuraea sp. G32]MDP4511938.1 TylF/MycF/NovP-related O-methyltransferase [Nonomuraea sp. G32]
MQLTAKANKVLQRFTGYSINLTPEFPPDYDQRTKEIIRTVRPYTMTCHARIATLVEATQYIQHHKIIGDIVECGVWRGGSMQAVALTLDSMNAADQRHLWLFDTFEGMPPPQDVDVAVQDGRSASEYRKQYGESWCAASLSDVKERFKDLSIPDSHIHYIQGRVEESIPVHSPEAIALLRLDTDWYESTLHELEHLYPKLTPGGVLILDDYGCWKGARQAVDEYFAKKGNRVFLARCDPTGARVVIKQN